MKHFFSCKTVKRFSSIAIHVPSVPHGGERGDHQRMNVKSDLIKYRA